MKKYLIALIFGIALSKASNAQLLINQLKNFNYCPYIGQPINNLLGALPSGYTLSDLHPAHTNKKVCASIMNVLYPGITLTIFAKNFTHMNPCAPRSTWDVNLFRQEQFATLLLYDSEGNCISVCQ